MKIERSLLTHCQLVSALVFVSFFALASKALVAEELQSLEQDFAIAERMQKNFQKSFSEYEIEQSLFITKQGRPDNQFRLCSYQNDGTGTAHLSQASWDSDGLHVYARNMDELREIEASAREANPGIEVFVRNPGTNNCYPLPNQTRCCSSCCTRQEVYTNNQCLGTCQIVSSSCQPYSNCSQGSCRLGPLAGPIAMINGEMIRNRPRSRRNPETRQRWLALPIRKRIGARFFPRIAYHKGLIDCKVARALLGQRLYVTLLTVSLATSGGSAAAAQNSAQNSGAVAPSGATSGATAMMPKAPPFVSPPPPVIAPPIVTPPPVVMPGPVFPPIIFLP